VKNKIIVTFIVFIIFFGFIVSKAFYIQVINKEKLMAYAKSQFIRQVEIFPHRGSIYDRNGEPLAINIQSYNVFTIPKDLNKTLSNLKKLSKIVPDFNYKPVWESIKKRKRYTWIFRKKSLSDEQLVAIKKLDNIFVENIYRRYYPNNELMSQVIGFVGLDNAGLSGVEYQFNKSLKGKSKIVKYYKDAKGRPVKFQVENSRVDSKDVILSLDKEIQAAVELYLKEAVDLHQAKSGGAAVMDVNTGEIWAMANYPTFDANKKRNNSQNSRLSFITDPIEPGSTLKTITVAAALDQEVIDYDSSFYCEKGKFKVDNHFIKEAEGNKQFEWLSVEDILKFSSNIGTTKIAFELTYPRLKNKLKIFGFGEKTGVELPGESRGIFNEKENVSPLTLSNISFGQGIAVNGLQLMTAYAAIANGGLKVVPTIVKGVQQLNGTEVIKKSTALQVEKMLISSVDSGTGTNAKIEHFEIAGKTSTAQKINNGQYDSYVSGFIGYPVNVDNRFVVYVYIDSPTKNGYYGNKVAAPVFNKITRFILLKNKEYSNIAFDEKPYQIDKVNSVTSSVSKMVFAKDVIPSFIGLDKKSVESLARKHGLKVKHDGYGLAHRQSLEPGNSITKNKIIEIYYKVPTNE
jgi:cell division protein FtsI (penicillin-binding protein 3)